MDPVYLDLCQGPEPFCGLDFKPFDGIAFGSGGICAVSYAGIAIIRRTIYKTRCLRSPMIRTGIHHREKSVACDGFC